jgi:hypothetical protein
MDRSAAQGTWHTLEVLIKAEREKTWRRAVVAYLQIFSLNLPVGTEETHEQFQSG